MITRRRVIGASVVKFLPSADRATKPADDAAGYLDLGIGDWAIESTATYETLMAPSPGKRVAYDEIQTSGGVTLTGTGKEMSNLSIQLMMGAADITAGPTAGGAYVPLAGPQKVNGWLQIDYYDGDNAAVDELRLYVSLKLAGPLPNGDTPNDVPLVATVLMSPLNSGTLA